MQHPEMENNPDPKPVDDDQAAKQGGEAGNLTAGNLTVDDDQAAKQDGEAGNLTAGGALYPKKKEDPRLRWAFIGKVYAIIAVQFLITASIGATFYLVRPIRRLLMQNFRASIALFILVCILPLIALVPMLYFRKRHPINMVFLFLHTVCISLLFGYVAVIFDVISLVEAAFVTAMVLFALSLYTFWAARRGHDFLFLAPFLLVSALVLLAYLVLQIVTGSRPTSSIYSCLATVVWSGFIIYDTDNLIKRHDYSQYTVAAVGLHLDVVNFFMSLLDIHVCAD